ncbi:isopenicillin N synthase family dioxygenase [Williamsia sp. MIQD14]|uniref:isopenicillin N synthase family dioxygenase n=1 Tax=Williamsia sp. MIQD14 TaxID=3425703 RepID=UPI003DA19423
MGDVIEVPVIDLSGPRHDVVAEVDDACRRVGFLQIVGHGINAAVADGLADAMDAFFALPAEVRAGYRVPGANRGYSPPKSESLSLSLGVESVARMNDFFEAFNVGVEGRSFPGLDLDESDYGINLWPDVAGFRENVEAWFAEAGRVARALTSIFAEALHLPLDFFTAITDHSIDVLRMNNYALPPGTLAPDGKLTGMGEHTDFGIVTVLWADPIPGLQIVGPEGRWQNVEPVDGALLVNLGDLTARLTNDRWRSTLHRVRPPVVDGAIRRRRSAAFFHDGNPDAVIATLPGFDSAADGLAYAPIRIRDHIAAKLAGSRQGRSNAAAIREAQRVLDAR